MIGKQPVPMTGGVNAFKDPTTLTDNEIQPSENFSSQVGGEPGTRPGLTFLREINPSEPWRLPKNTLPSSTESRNYATWARYLRPRAFRFAGPAGVVAILNSSSEHQRATVWQPELGNFDPARAPLIAAGQNVVWVPGLYGYNYINGTADELGGIGSGPYVGLLGVGMGPVSLIEFDGIVYAFDGFSEGLAVIPTPVESSDANPISVGFQYVLNVWSTEQTEPYWPKGAAVVGQRVVYYTGGNLIWSDRNFPLSIYDDALSSGYPVTTNEGLDISAIATLALSAAGSPNTTALGVWTRRSMYMVTGEPAETDDPLGTPLEGTLQTVKLGVQAGCISAATVANTPYGTLWVGEDDVWLMQFGTLPIRVGTKIRNIIQQIPDGLAYRVCAEYDNGYYRIALWAPGTGPNENTPLNQVWWLDLNDGAPQSADQAVWYGPHNLVNGDGIPDEGSTEPTSGIWAMARAPDGSMNTLQSYVLTSTTTAGRVYGMSLAGFIQGVGRDVTAPNYPTSVPWTPNTDIAAGNMYIPPSDGANFIWVCITGGTTGGSSPDFASNVQELTDGTVLWGLKYISNVGFTADYLPAFRSPSQMTSNAIAMTVQSKEYTLEGVNGEGAGKEKLMDGAEITYTTDQPVRVTYTTAPDQTSNSRELDRFTE